MEHSDKTARQIWNEVKANPSRARFGFGRKAVLVNIDLQNAYTKTDEFKTAYETDPRQLEYVNRLATDFRSLGWPVVWTHVAYMESAEDAGVWGTRTNTADSLQNIKFGSRRAAFDERLEVDRIRDVIYLKKMPSAFFETQLQSLLVWHQIDTVILTGGSSQLRMMPELVYRRTGVVAKLGQDPYFCVARGTGIALKHLDTYQKSILAKQ